MAKTDLVAALVLELKTLPPKLLIPAPPTGVGRIWEDPKALLN